MKRKKIKNRKQLLKIILIPSIILVVASAVLFTFLAYPYLTSFLKNSQVKSAATPSDSLNELKKQLESRKIDYKSVNLLAEDNLEIILTNNIQVLLKPSSSIKAQIETLHQLLRQLTIESREAKSIDLRFKPPVVKF